MISVLPSSSMSMSASMMRPICASQCASAAAYTSIMWAATFLWSALSESQAGMPVERSVSLVSCGTMPSVLWRASVSSRTLSQPWSNWPLNLAIQSLGAWCGACAVPGAY
jgi:hypothetical protein